MQGNVIAQLALLLWLPLALFASTMMPPRRAALTIFIGGILYLPERVAFDFPVLPPFDKQTISALAAYLACLVSKPKSVSGVPHSSTTRNILLLSTIGAVISAALNGDAQRYGPTVLQAITMYDSISFVVNGALQIALPFFLGQALFRNAADLEDLLVALVMSALYYFPFILLEARLSPIFHLKLYGFFQHDFLQAMRAGGFRAFVFMAHGLAVAFFVAQALLAVAGLSRMKAARSRLPLAPGLVITLLIVALASCKSMGATIYALIGVPLLLWGSPKRQVGFAAWLSIAVLAYPLSRMTNVFPTEWLLEQVTAISADRAQSLEFRFDNENLLLAHAQERPWFGWGGWGRNHVHSEIDGRPLTVTDGEWIIRFGTGGSFGFILVFGLLLLPVFRAKRAVLRGELSPQGRQAIATLALILAFVGLDLIPNAVFNSLPYLLAGAATSASRAALRGTEEKPTDFG